jgi:hypothetical protein
MKKKKQTKHKRNARNEVKVPCSEERKLLNVRLLKRNERETKILRVNLPKDSKFSKRLMGESQKL